MQNLYTPAMIDLKALLFTFDASYEPFDNVDSETEDQSIVYAAQAEYRPDTNTYELLPALVHALVHEHARRDVDLTNAANFLSIAMRNLLVHEFTTFNQLQSELAD